MTENTEIFNRLYQENADFVYRRCLSYLRNEEDARDAAQDIWVRVYFALPKFRGDAAPSTWLYRITANHCVNLLRKRRFFVSIDDQAEFLEVEKNNDDMHERFAVKQDVTNALAHLSKETRTLLLLKEVEGFTYKEIAALTGLGESAIKMRISRAKLFLQSNLQP